MIDVSNLDIKKTEGPEGFEYSGGIVVKSKTHKMPVELVRMLLNFDQAEQNIASEIRDEVWLRLYGEVHQSLFTTRSKLRSLIRFCPSSSVLGASAEEILNEVEQLITALKRPK